MKPKEIAHRRMHSLRLWGAPFADPRDVVGHLGALQAQEYAYAKWSIAQRSKDANDATIQRLFDEGVILRTHLLRPTWHFALSVDIRWLLELTAPRVHASNAYMYRQLEIDPKVLAKSHRLFAESLSGGAHMTRRELGSLLDKNGIDATGLRLGYLLMQAELEALICSGAMRGKQHTYALLEERAPKAKRLDRETALAELTKRYFVSRGPATVKDYARWSSLTMTDCRRGLEMIDSTLEQDVVGDRTYRFAPSQALPRLRARTLDLVQGYDECVMSYSESRDALFDTVASSEPAYLHAILLDGRLIGHWKRTEKRGAIVIETSLHRSFDRSEMNALRKAVDRYGVFLGRAATLA